MVPNDSELQEHLAADALQESSSAETTCIPVS